MYGERGTGSPLSAGGRVLQTIHRMLPQRKSAALHKKYSAFFAPGRIHAKKTAKQTERLRRSKGACTIRVNAFKISNNPSRPPVKVGVSKIKVGGKVKHKAFGVGTVTAFAKDTISVRFSGIEKKFQFPAALTQGHLSLLEE